MAELSNQELLDELGVDAKSVKKAKFSAKEERVIAGFEEIQRFVEEHGHAPEHGEDKDIFERLYAVRLDQIRAKDECRKLVNEIDFQGLLNTTNTVAEPSPEYTSDSDILSELGVSAPKESDVTFLKHVRPRAEVKAAEEIANRTPCENFDRFAPLFAQIENDLRVGLRKTIRFGRDTSIEQANFFILSGQMVYVAEVGEDIKAPNGEPDARLKVIYSNGTESNLLRRSLQRALYKDEAGRRITDTDAGPLFSEDLDARDVESGTIYVLRSKSDLPEIAENSKVIHKIGVTSGSVEKRIANAKLDPTYLMADVEVVASYNLFNINSAKLEKLIHKFFQPVKLDIEVVDRFGNPVKPQEWFMVPLIAIDKLVEKITDGSIGDYLYNLESGSLEKRQK